MTTKAGSLTIGLAHHVFRLAEAFAPHAGRHVYFQVRTAADLEARLADADVLVIGGLWRNEHLARAPRLRFIQSITAGINQYDVAAIRAHGVRLATARGVNERAVAQHALAMMLTLFRRLHHYRDAQPRTRWVGMAQEADARADEVTGKTLLIIGFGAIGQRLGRYAKALEMRVIGVRQSPAPLPEGADEVIPARELTARLPEADVVVVACPLTPATAGLVDATALAAMKPGAVLLNVGRGKVVDEAALTAALREGRLAAAGLDCFVTEPLPAQSPLWGMANVIVTPHIAGETQRYETALIALLVRNLEALREDRPLENEVPD